MRMIEADKVIPLVRLLLLFHPNAERIVEDMQAVVDSHTIEAEPVRHGEWISRYAKHWKGKDECGECGFHEKDHSDLSHYKYCPNCGAKMDGEKK